MRCERFSAALFVIATGVGAGLVEAQSYPTKPIRFIVPYTAGGSVDAIARMVSQKLTENLSQQVIVENRSGAAGRIGMETAVKATPDGYSMVMLANNQTIVPSVYKEIPYDLARDLAPVGMMATLANVLVVHNTVPANSVAELINLAKAKPGTINFGSGGSGGTTHFAGELFKFLAQVNIVHVPYKGSAPAMNDLVAGSVQMMLLNMLNSLPHIRSGRLKGLAVTSLRRSRFAPDLPTLDESGVKGYELVEWYGIAVPANTPRQIVAKLHDELAKAMNSADVKDRLDKQAVEVALGSSVEFGAFLKADLAKYAQIVKDAGIRPE